jgi:hypothetical protein
MRSGISYKIVWERKQVYEKLQRSAMCSELLWMDDEHTSILWSMSKIFQNKDLLIKGIW